VKKPRTLKFAHAIDSRVLEKSINLAVSRGWTSTDKTPDEWIAYFKHLNEQTDEIGIEEYMFLFDDESFTDALWPREHDRRASMKNPGYYHLARMGYVNQPLQYVWSSIQHADPRVSRYGLKVPPPKPKKV
jgi:hypothetical protein